MEDGSNDGGRSSEDVHVKAEEIDRITENADIQKEKGVRGRPGHPVDAGYAWVVMFAVLGLQVIMIGYIKALGIFFVEFQERFELSSSVTSLILGLMELTVSVGSYFVMSFFMKLVTPQTSCLIGSAFLTVSVAGNAWFQKVEFLYLTQGILYGAAMAFLFGPAFIPLTQYFNKRRALATSVATCGACLGGVVFPPLCRFLLDTYAFEGGVLMTAGVMMQSFIFSSLLTPTETYEIQSDKKKCFLVSLFSNHKSQQKYRYKLKNHLQESDGDFDGSTSTNGTNSSFFNSSAKRNISALNINLSLLENCDSHEKQIEIESRMNERQTISLTLIRKLCIKCRTIYLERALIQSPSFWLLSAYFFSASIGTVIPQTYLPVLCLERGLSETDGAYFLSLMSVLGFPGHLLPGVIVNFGLLTPTTVSIVPLLLVGLMSCSVPLLTDYWSLLPLVIIHGIFSGTYFATQPMIVIQVLEQKYFVAAMGVFILFTGVGAAISYPICGALRDITGTYSSTFIFLGTMEIFAAFLLVLTPWSRIYDAKKMSDTNRPHTTC